MQLVIIAGGKGTRLGLKDIPKPMCPIAGKPLLEHQILLAKRYGITDILILSGHLADVIINYFGDGHKWGVNIRHLVESHPLGTAGCLKMAAQYLAQRFLVFYGDVVMDFDIQHFIDFDRQVPNTMGSLIVHPGNHPYDSDLVDVDDKNCVKRFLPKPHPKDLLYRNINNAAVYILNKDILNFIPNDTACDFGHDIFPQVIASGAVLRAYDTPEFIRDMGTPERLKKIEADFLSGLVSSSNREHKRRAIFLDRDGTINVNRDKDISVENFELLPRVADAIRKINESNYLAIVVTNQPMIAKGFISFEDLANIHKKMETLLGAQRAYVDAIYFCPHHPDKGFPGEVPELKIDCDCRKPKPGMLLSAAKDFNIDLSSSWMLGDSDTDIQAGKAAGCRTLKINTENCKDLYAAVTTILENNS